jgi:hypothetical protein
LDPAAHMVGRLKQIDHHTKIYRNGQKGGCALRID